MFPEVSNLGSRLVRSAPLGCVRRYGGRQCETLNFRISGGNFWSSEPRCRLKAGAVRPRFTTNEGPSCCASRENTFRNTSDHSASRNVPTRDYYGKQRKKRYLSGYEKRDAHGSMRSTQDAAPADGARTGTDLPHVSFFWLSTSCYGSFLLKYPQPQRTPLENE